MRFTGNLITVLRLLNNTIFYLPHNILSAVDRDSVIIKNVRTSFETLDTRLLDALRDANTEQKIMSTEVLEMALDKKRLPIL